MINTHAIAHFVAVGYEKLAASFYFGLMGFIRIGATIIWGSVSDRIGRSKAYSLGVFVTALGLGCMIAMTFDAPVWLVYLTIALYGVGHSAGNPTYGAVISDIFSGQKIGLIFGLLEVSFGLGSALRLVDRRLSIRCHRLLCVVLHGMHRLFHDLRAGNQRMRALARPRNGALMRDAALTLTRFTMTMELVISTDCERSLSITKRHRQTT